MNLDHVVRSALGALTCSIAVLIPGLVDAQDVTWDAGGGDLIWGTAANWDGDQVPLATETARFNDQGAAGSPISITNILDMNRTVGGLTFQNTLGNFHQTDLGGFELTVDGPLDVNGGTLNGSFGALSNGDLIVGTVTRRDMFVGTQAVPGAGSFSGTLDLDNLTSFTALLDDLEVGTSTSGSSQIGGRLTLAMTNDIDANTITIGQSHATGNSGQGLLELGMSNTILTNELTVGIRESSSDVTIPNGGTLVLGGILQRANVTIGDSESQGGSTRASSIDLTGATFNAFLENLVVGHMGTGSGSGAVVDASFIGGASGAVDIGSTGNTADLIIGRAVTRTAIGTVDFSGLDTLDANLNQLLVGSSLPSASASGTLLLPLTSTIDANTIVVGDRASATLELGTANVFDTDALMVAKDSGTATVDMPVPGGLELGTPERRALLSIADQNFSASSTFTGTLDLTGGTLNADLSSLIVARKNGGDGTTNGQLLGPVSGAVSIGAMDAPGELIVGHTVSGGTAIGNVDFSGIAELSADVNQVLIGVRDSGASVSGTLTLAANSTIHANTIVVGSNGSGLLQLGTSTVIDADSFRVAEDFSTATVEMPAPGTLTLGSPERRTLLAIADQSFNSNSTRNGAFDLSGGTFNAHLSDLIVARKNGSVGNTSGQLIGATSGVVSVGEETARGDFVVGHTILGGSATGNVDFAGLSEFTAYLNQMLIGVRDSGSSASGTVALAATNTIDANTVVVGSSGSGLLQLGTTTTIEADSFFVAEDFSNATVEMLGPGTFNLGSPSRRTLLSIAEQNFNSNSQITGIVDLSGAEFNADLSDLIVARKTGGPGTTTGQLIGATGGAMTVGEIGSRGDIVIGQTIGGGSATGVVDLSGVDTLDAHLNELLLGSAAGATLMLPADSTIDALSVRVGVNASATLNLGPTANIQADQLILADGLSNSTIDIALGGTFTLGAPERRTGVRVSQSDANTNSHTAGTIDLSGATFVGYLGDVFLGEKTGGGGGTTTATMTIGTSPDNLVDATSFTLGVAGNGHGILNFQGGEMTAGAIQRGTGTATFNWTAGALHVGEFGSAITAFNLQNLGSGTLSPGGSVGSTTVFGQYHQGVFATSEIEIESEVSFDTVSVSDEMFLDGTLRASLLGGFEPAPGNSFEVLAAAARSGEFSDFDGPGVVGNAFLFPFYTQTSAWIVATFTGDGSLDGTVGPEDYTLWANGFGMPDPEFTDGDYNGDGMVGPEDYTLWANNSGESIVLPSGPEAAVSAIPEPSSWLLFSVGCMVVLLRRHERR